MKVLIVCSGKPSNRDWSFEIDQSYVYEQIESLKKFGVSYDTYIIEGKGALGYLKNYKGLMQKIKSYKPDCIHAHYGLSGLLSNLQRRVPVITTFHGCDINEKTNQKFAKITTALSAENIFVNKILPPKINYSREPHVIPCGVDTCTFFHIDKKEARKRMGLEIDKKYALFASSFDLEVKNYPLAKASIEKCKSDIELIELKGYTREEVNLLMNAVDFLLMTSLSEGSPMVIKEAISCNCPIISVDVGDVKSITKGLKQCYIVPYDSDKIAKQIDKLISECEENDNRESIEEYSLDVVSTKIFEVYKKVVEEI